MADELLERSDEIVQRWYEAWRSSSHPHPELGEAALKDLLPAQLRVIGAQLRDLAGAERTEEMWKVSKRLDPEQRVAQSIPIEEVVQEYRLAVETIRAWIEERAIAVSFREYSYFFDAIFELTAESVRRYAGREADRVSRERRAYLATVMHQLKSPLAAIAMQVDTFMRQPEPGAEPGLARLERSVQRARRLVDGVLRLERFRPDELPVHPRSVQACEFLEKLMADFEHDATSKGLRYEARVSPSLALHVDPDLLSDVLGNLVENAVRFTLSGFVVVDAEEAGDSVVFAVRDSGAGMSEEQVRTLFREPQLATAEGFGIGLQIAARAATALGGAIDVESAVGHGTIFRVRIAKRVAARPERAPDANMTVR